MTATTMTVPTAPKVVPTPPLTIPTLKRHHRAWWLYVLLIVGSYLLVRVWCG